MMWAMALLASCTYAPRDPWDDPDFVRTADVQNMSIDEFELRYQQISRIYSCSISSRFFREPRRAAVALILDEIRAAEQPEHCAAHNRGTFYRVCDHLCSTEPGGGYGPCDEAALAALPEGCHWIGWEEVFKAGKKIDSGPRWLDRPFPWRPGSPWGERHPPEIAQHYADEADVQATLRAYDATLRRP